MSANDCLNKNKDFLIKNNRFCFDGFEEYEIIIFDKSNNGPGFKYYWGLESPGENNEITLNVDEVTDINFYELIVKSLLRYRKVLCTDFKIQNYAFPLFEERTDDNSLGSYINFLRIIDTDGYQITPLLLGETRNYTLGDFYPRVNSNNEIKFTFSLPDNLDHQNTPNRQGTPNRDDRNTERSLREIIQDMVFKIFGNLDRRILNNFTNIQPAFLFEHDVTPIICLNNIHQSYELYIYKNKITYYILPKSTLAGSIDLDFQYPDREPFKFSISYAERDGDRSFRGYNRIIMDNLKKIGEAIVTESLKNILIKAKPGSGKESYSKLLHAGKSHKYRGPIMPVSTAGALDDVILRIFGEYKSGVNVPGIISKAKGGAVFFDEIDKSEVKLRGKLLRVMETEDYYPNGASTPEQRGTTLFIFAGANFENFEPPDFLTRLYGIEINNPISNNMMLPAVNKDYLRNLIIYFWFSYFIKLADQHDDNEMKNWIIREYIPRIFGNTRIFDDIFNEVIEMNINSMNFRSIKRTVELKAGKCYYGLDENCGR